MRYIELWEPETGKTYKVAFNSKFHQDMKKESKKTVKKVVKKTTPKRTVYRSSKTGKIVTKEFAEDHKTTTQKETIQGELYWQNRRLDDDKRDWRNGAKDWISEYVESKNHPHRELILTALKTFEPFAGVLEVGCNAGPNLLRISEKYPETQLAGFDVNADCVLECQRQLPKALLQIGTVLHIPFHDKEFDIVIADAVLIYVKDIERALEEMTRVARRGLIIVDWFSEKEKVVDHHYARNFPELLNKLGYDVETINLNEELWPSKNWVANGKVFVCRLRSVTGETN